MATGVEKGSSLPLSWAVMIRVASAGIVMSPVARRVPRTLEMLKLCFCIGLDNELIDEVNPKEVHVQVFADHEVAIGCLVLLFGGESIDSVKAQIIVASPFDSMGVILSLVLLERLKGEAHDEVGDLVSAYLNLDLVTVVVMGSQTLEKLFIEHLRVNKWTSQSCKSFQGPELGTHSDPLGKILQRSGGEWGCWLEFIAGGSQGGKTIHLWCCSTARCWPDERSKSWVRVQTSCSRCTSCKGEDCRIGSVRIDFLFLFPCPCWLHSTESGCLFC